MAKYTSVYTGLEIDSAVTKAMKLPTVSSTDEGKVLQVDFNGNIIAASSGGGTDVQINGTSITSSNVANIITNTAYNSSSNKIATMSDIPSVSVTTTTGSEAVTVDSSSLNVVTRDTAQTISGTKTFSTAPLLNNGIYLNGKNSGGTTKRIIGITSSNNVFINPDATGNVTIESTVRPNTSGSYDLGLSDKKWRDLYLSRNLTDGTNSITVANIVGKYTKPSGGIPSTDLAESYYLASNPNGYTTNTGTVTSVRVQAGTGLSSSTDTAQNTTLDTTISIASGYKLPTTSEWSGKQDALTTTAVNDGTINKVIGFDSQGNLVKSDSSKLIVTDGVLELV